ncbi:unnamed protein product [Pleuronectes platessa]|uniref:Uncharacterized protein n=1 Tax=Pleuronectes platessa TaxID=8262 RepID=A0A9N7VPK9_PLEPL|nr:unnamed protein product [Pleuronectes platessa]
MLCSQSQRLHRGEQGLDGAVVASTCSNTCLTTMILAARRQPRRTAGRAPPRERRVPPAGTVAEVIREKGPTRVQRRCRRPPYPVPSNGPPSAPAMISVKVKFITDVQIVSPCSSDGDFLVLFYLDLKEVFNESKAMSLSSPE